LGSLAWSLVVAGGILLVTGIVLVNHGLHLDTSRAPRALGWVANVTALSGTALVAAAALCSIAGVGILARRRRAVLIARVLAILGMGVAAVLLIGSLVAMPGYSFHIHRATVTMKSGPLAILLAAGLLFLAWLLSASLRQVEIETHAHTSVGRHRRT